MKRMSGTIARFKREKWYSSRRQRKSTYPWQNTRGAISPGKSATLVNRFMEKVGVAQLEGKEEGDSRSGPSDIRILNIPDLTTNYTFTSIDTRSLLSSMKGGGGEGAAWNKAVPPPPIFDNDRSFGSIQGENNKVLRDGTYANSLWM